MPIIGGCQQSPIRIKKDRIFFASISETDYMKASYSGALDGNDTREITSSLITQRNRKGKRSVLGT